MILLVNILGCDGVGKTSIINNLVNSSWSSIKTIYTLDKWMSLYNIDEYPGVKFIKEPTIELKDSLADLSSNNRYLFLVLLYSIAINNVKDNIKKADCICFIDGYWHKHLCSELALGGDIEWMKKVCSNLPIPELTIVLDLDPAIAYQRKEGIITRCESGCLAASKDNFISHQSKLRENILKEAVKYEWPIIDANRDITVLNDIIFNLILKHITEEKNL